MALTSKQQAFCDAILQGNNQSDAYRLAYNVDNMLPETVHSRAYELMQDGEIAASVAEARQRNRDWTVATILADCDTNLAGARQDHQWSAANAIVTTGAKVAGVLTDKVDISVTHTLKPGLTLEELEARVTRLDALEAGALNAAPYKEAVVEGKATLVDESSDG